MVVCLNTGMHRLFDDSKEYYHYACGTGVEAGKWFVKHKVKCVAMDSQALDHPLHTAMGKNGPPHDEPAAAPPANRSPMSTSRSSVSKPTPNSTKRSTSRLHGKAAYDAKFGDLEAIGQEGTWEPCHKQMLGHGIVGVENLGGDLDKVSGKRFRFYCFPIRWYMGDGSMVRCVAEIDEDRRRQGRSGSHLHVLRHRLRPGQRDHAVRHLPDGRPDQVGRCSRSPEATRRDW